MTTESRITKNLINLELDERDIELISYAIEHLLESDLENFSDEDIERLQRLYREL